MIIAAIIKEWEHHGRAGRENSRTLSKCKELSKTEEVEVWKETKEGRAIQGKWREQQEDAFEEQAAETEEGWGRRRGC